MLATYEEHRLQRVLRFTRKLLLPFYFGLCIYITVTQDADTARGKVRIWHCWIVFGWFSCAIAGLHFVPLMQRHWSMILVPMLLYGVIWEFTTASRFDNMFSFIIHQEGDEPSSNGCIEQLANSEPFVVLRAYMSIALVSQCRVLKPLEFNIIAVASVIVYILELGFLKTTVCVKGCVWLVSLFMVLCTFSAFGVKMIDGNLRAAYSDREDERAEVMEVFRQASVAIGVFKMKQRPPSQQQPKMPGPLQTVLGTQSGKEAECTLPASTFPAEVTDSISIEVWNTELARITQTPISEGTDWLDVPCQNTKSLADLKVALMRALGSSRERTQRMLLPFVRNSGVVWLQLDVWPLLTNDGSKAVLLASDITDFVEQHRTLLQHTCSRGFQDMNPAGKLPDIVAQIYPYDYMLGQCSPQFDVFFQRRMNGECLLQHVESTDDQKDIMHAVQQVLQGYGPQQVSIYFFARAAGENLTDSNDRLNEEGENEFCHHSVWLKFSRCEQADPHCLLDLRANALVVEIMHMPNQPSLQHSNSMPNQPSYQHSNSDSPVKTSSDAMKPKSISKLGYEARSSRAAHTVDNSQLTGEWTPCTPYKEHQNDALRFGDRSTSQLIHKGDTPTHNEVLACKKTPSKDGRRLQLLKEGQMLTNAGTLYAQPSIWQSMYKRVGPLVSPSWSGGEGGENMSPSAAGSFIMATTPVSSCESPEGSSCAHAMDVAMTLASSGSRTPATATGGSRPECQVVGNSLSQRSQSMSDRGTGISMHSEGLPELTIEVLGLTSVDDIIGRVAASWHTDVRSSSPERVVARGLELFHKCADGGALMVVAPQEELDSLQKLTRTSDGGYLTARLRGVHICSEEFKKTFTSFTDHKSSECDRWPIDWPDEEARNQPKDGAMLVSASGYRVKCAVKLVGLPMAPKIWPTGVGARHETALQLACFLRKAIVYVRSDTGKLHVFSVDPSGFHVYHVNGHGKVLSSILV